MSWGGFSPHQRLQWARKGCWKGLVGAWNLPVVGFFCAVSPMFCVVLSAQLFASLSCILPFCQSPIPAILGQTYRAKLHPETPSITSNHGVTPEHLWSPKLSNQNFLQLLKYRKPCITLSKAVQFPPFLQKRNQPSHITDLASLSISALGS